MNPHGINMKPSPAIPLASSTCKPAQSNAVWKEKLVDNKVEVTISDTAAKLVQRAGLIGPEQYCDAVEIADSLKKTVDQVIITSFMTDKQKDLVESAMSYLDRGIINDTLASDALAVANHKGISFTEGLKYHGFGW